MQSRDASLIELDDGGVFSTHSGYNNDALDLVDLGDVGEATLCQRCLNFDIQSFAKSANHRRGYLLRDVETAAAGGCEFCSLLLASLQDTQRPTYFYVSFARRKPTDLDLYVHMTLSENYSEAKNQSGSTGLKANRLQTEVGARFSKVKNVSEYELCLAADPGSPAATNGDIIGRCLSCNPASDEHFSTIREWIKECSTHPKCNQTVSGSTSIDAYRSPLPARCVEISRNGKNVFLRNTEGLYGSYITLTHRWSPETEICKTTKSNYQDRLEGRGFEQISPLFKDVFVIAAKLDVRYVWIDSICIIQYGDEGADWRREAPKMAQYYQFSLFTVAGTMPDMKNGILSSHGENNTPWASKLVRLPYRNKTNTQQGYFYVYKRRIPLMDEYWSLIRESILFRRGWILQEWLLSKRLLWYTSKGLFFECQTDMPRTDCQEKIPFEITRLDLRSHLKLKASFHFTNIDILGFWYHAVVVYSACNLTKPEQDRILAVAGVAKEIGAILAKSKNVIATGTELQNAVYLAGLWLRDIHHGLLWEQEHSTKPWTTRVHGIPSWSWASLMTPVKWPERGKGTQEAFKVTGVCFKNLANRHDRPEHIVTRKYIIRQRDNSSTNVPTRGPQQHLFNPINTFSCLHIRGKFYTVHVRGYLETEENLYTAAFSTAYGATPKSCQWRAICSPARPEIIAGWGSLEQMDSDANTCSDSGTAVYALHVSTRYLRSGLWIERADPILDVLFLKQISDNSPVYTRLGVGRIADQHLIKEFHSAKDQDLQLI